MHQVVEDEGALVKGRRACFYKMRRWRLTNKLVSVVRLRPKPHYRVNRVVAAHLARGRALWSSLLSRRRR